MRREFETSENSLRYPVVGLPGNTFRTNTAGIWNSVSPESLVAGT